MKAIRQFACAVWVVWEKEVYIKPRLLSINIIIISIHVNYWPMTIKENDWSHEPLVLRNNEMWRDKVMAWEKNAISWRMENWFLLSWFFLACFALLYFSSSWAFSFNKLRIFVWRQSRKQQPKCNRICWQWNSLQRLRIKKIESVKDFVAMILIKMERCTVVVFGNLES